MEDLGVGAGLAALAFWIFIAAIVVASYWDVIRKRDAQHETLRRAIESGQQLDEKVLNTLLEAGGEGSGRVDRDFIVTAYWTLPISPALAAFALVLGTQVPDARIPLLGAAALIGVLGVGFFIAGKALGRWYQSDTNSAPADR
jgi:nitrate/nitrite transporter NarK